MIKTFITSMPDRIGAFLKASRVFAELGINIARVSYNKAVDAHYLFIDAEGGEAALAEASKRLEKIGYLPQEVAETQVVLLELRLLDEPGVIEGVLELVEQYGFNICYMNSRASDGEYQYFKMGISVGGDGRLGEFLERARKLCQVNVVDYNRSEKVFDNSVFYRSFIEGLADMTRVAPEKRGDLMVNANLAMQTLDDAGRSPFIVFDSIFGFARLLAKSAGGGFSPRITSQRLSDRCELILIEPDCGSNTAIFKCGGEALFIDCGYALYRAEMDALLRRLLPDFDRLVKKAVLTHADVDHCGIASIFDEISVSRKTAECFAAERAGEDGFREKNPLHRPYVKICKILTDYTPPEADKIRVPWADCDEQLLNRIGGYAFADLDFEVYQGKGGHLAGEIVLIERVRRIAFTGDVFVNLRGMTSRQKKFNGYAPILMTSVDTDPELCKKEREAIFQLLGGGEWTIYGAHGSPKSYSGEQQSREQKTESI